MATDANGKWVGIGVGDVDSPATARNAPNWNAITLLTTKLSRNYQWARNLGIVPQANYDTVTASAVAEFCRRTGLPATVDASGQAVATLAMRTRLGSYPPPAPPTHAMFTVRGTGGIIGQDYTSQIAQALPGVYHEHPIDYAAAMGGIPVGVSTSGPSGDECAIQACQMLADAVMGSTVSFAVAGYSLGCKGPVLFLNRLFDPADPLYAHRNRLVCVVLVADPWRPFGKTFFLGPVPDGQGIGAPYFTMSPAAQTALGYRCCWLVNPPDMYANAPLGGTGQVLADVEEIVLEAAVSDPLGTIARAIPLLLRIVEKDGGLDLPALGKGLLTSVTAQNVGAMLPLILPMLLGSFQGLIAGISTNGINLPPGPAADVQAAILALKFFGSGTAGHISYHNTPWGIGPQTYLQLGVQHAEAWGRQVPVVA